MRGRHRRTDRNQAEIARALRQIGCTVQDISLIGGGCPDLLVGKHRVNFLFEVKDGNAPPSARRLTEDEAQWIDSWRGAVFTVESVDEAIRIVETHAPVVR